MYSIVLMVAMTSPAEAPTFGKRLGGCHGGSCAGSTSCNGCNGAKPAGCNGAHHAPMAAPAAPMAAPAHAPAAMPGGYSCGGCGGCGGKFFGKKAGCWSDNGYKTSFSCHGAGACHGYAYAGAGSGFAYGFAGCYGSCYGSITHYFSYWSYPGTGAYAAPTGPMMPPPPPPVGIPGTVPPARNIIAPAPAGVIVSLPADAKLMANGQMMEQIGVNRNFITPELVPGITYNY